MLKRVFPIIAVLVLLVSVFAIPSYAIGSGQDILTRYSALTFDTIEFNADVAQTFVTLPYPFNSGNGVIERYAYGNTEQWPSDDYLGYGFCGMTDDSNFPTIIGTFISPILSEDLNSQTTFDLKGGQQIVQVPRLRDFIISADSSQLRIIQASYEIYYNLIQPNEALNEYGAETYVVDQYIPIENNHVLLGQQLSYYFGDYLDFDFLFIEHIEVHIVFERVGAATTKFTFDIPTDGSQYPNQHINLNNWLLTQDATYKNITESAEDFSFSNWLIQVVGGFLDFQLVPGLSISSILNIFLVIGIFLWFVKLIH